MCYAQERRGCHCSISLCHIPRLPNSTIFALSPNTSISCLIVQVGKTIHLCVNLTFISLAISLLPFSIEYLHQLYNFVDEAHSVVAEGCKKEGAIVINSKFLAPITIGPRTLIEHSVLNSPTTSVGSSCLVSGINIIIIVYFVIKH